MNRQLSPGWTLFVLTGLNLFNYLDRFIIAAVITPLKEELHISDGDAGRIVTAFMIGYFFTSPFFGYLGDRVPRKWLIAIGIFVWSLGTVLTGFATSLGMLLSFRVLVGLGEASYATMSPGLISDAFGPAKRNNALTIFYVAIPVGAALGNILGGQIAAHYSWRTAFIWAGAPGLLLALVLLPFRERGRGQADGTTGEDIEKPSLRSALKLFRNKNLMLLLIGYTAYTFAVGAFGNWGPTFLHRLHQVPFEQAATFFGIVLVMAGLVGTLLGGFAATFWQKRNPAGYALVNGLSVLAAVPAALTAFLSSSAVLSMAALGLAMFLLFLSTGPTNTLILESVPVNLRSSAMALSIFMIHLFGDMWSSEIVGHLSDHWHSLQKAVLILPIALLISGVLWQSLAIKILRASRREHAAKAKEPG